MGDATQEQTLRDARIEHARGLVAATTTDATNLYIVLTARGLNPRLRIIARASEEKAEKHLLTAGADSVVSPYIFAGQRIAQSFLRPHVVSFLDTATTHLGMDLEIGEVAIIPKSPFAGKTIESSRIRQERGVIVLAIKREAGMRFNPAPDDRIESGDFLIAMGEPQQLRELEQMAAPRIYEDRERSGNARDRSLHLGAIRRAFPDADGECRIRRCALHPLGLSAKPIESA